MPLARLALSGVCALLAIGLRLPAALADGAPAETVARALPAFVNPVMANPGTFVPWDGKSPPTRDLLSYFPKTVAIQQGGSCHIYSSVALFQAFCKKELGKDVDVSEAFLVYRHLNDRFRLPDGNPLPDGYVAAFRAVPTIESGYPLDTLGRIKQGMVCTNDEFKPAAANFHFMNFMRDYLARYASSVDQAGVQAAKDAGAHSETLDVQAVLEAARKAGRAKMAGYSAALCDELDKSAQCALKIPAVSDEELAGTGVKTKTWNADLQRCAERMAEPRKLLKPSPAELKQWVDRGFPVLCTTYAAHNLSTAWTDQERYIGDHRIGTHAFVIYGQNSSADGKKTEFFVRDSNFATTPAYSVTGCDEAVMLESHDQAREREAGEAAAAPAKPASGG